MHGIILVILLYGNTYDGVCGIHIIPTAYIRATKAGRTNAILHPRKILENPMLVARAAMVPKPYATPLTEFNIPLDSLGDTSAT